MTAQVHLVAGLNGAGKTTLARHLERTLPAVRFSLDEWMLRLHGLTFDRPRYPELSASCQELIWDMAGQVVRTGSPVVLDWNQWSRQRRADAAHRAAQLGAPCHLHHVVVPLDTAIERVLGRTDPQAHRLGTDGVRHLHSIFETPQQSEGGFELHLVTPGVTSG